MKVRRRTIRTADHFRNFPEAFFCEMRPRNSKEFHFTPKNVFDPRKSDPGTILGNCAYYPQPAIQRLRKRTNFHRISDLEIRKLL